MALLARKQHLMETCISTLALVMAFFSEAHLTIRQSISQLDQEGTHDITFMSTSKDTNGWVTKGNRIG